MSVLSHQAFINPTLSFWDAKNTTTRSTFVAKSFMNPGRRVINSPDPVVVDSLSFTVPFQGYVVVVANTTFEFSGATGNAESTLLLSLSTDAGGGTTSKITLSPSQIDTATLVSISSLVTENQVVNLSFSVQSPSPPAPNPFYYTNPGWTVYMFSE